MAIAACAPCALAEDAFPNQPGALSPEELKTATSVLAASLPAEAPKLSLLASGRRGAGHSMPAYVVFESIEEQGGSPPKRAICNFLLSTSRWHCAELPPQARVVLQPEKQSEPVAPLPSAPVAPRRSTLEELSGLSEPLSYLSMFIALLALIVPVVVSLTRGLAAAAAASIVLMAASWVFGGVASVLAFSKPSPYAGMILFFVVPPALVALLASAVWWSVLLIAKLRGRG